MNTAEYKLVVDIGNTRVKSALVCDGRILRRNDMDRRNFRMGAWRVMLKKLVGSSLCRRAVYSSVVPELDRQLEQGLRAVLGCPVTRASHKLVSGIKLEYSKPSTLGIDRLIHAAAAFSKHGGPIIVVSAGTATTVDCVTRDGRFIGGAIAPGVTMMAEAIHSATAKLPLVDCFDHIPAIGKNTVQCLQLGIGAGYCGMIGLLIRKLARYAGMAKPVICVTGGAAGALKFDFPCRIFKAPDLLLIGLAELVRERKLK
jgi:type III pantothenate kinase